MDKKLVIFFLPAESISIQFSRSAYIKEHLAKNHTVYLLRWLDYRDYYWTNKPLTWQIKMGLFFRNIFRRTSFKQTESQTIIHVHTSLFIDAFINRIIGKSIAKKIMHTYNKVILKYIQKKINADIIFHADGYYYSSNLTDNATCIVDFQDDFSKALTSYEISHLRKQLIQTDLVITLSKEHETSLHAKLGLHSQLHCTVIPNGINKEDYTCKKVIARAQQLKANIGNSYKIISYIGSEVWVDYTFAKSFAKKVIASSGKYKIKLVIVGNVKPFIKHPDILFTGSVFPEEANAYYLISDVGILMKDAEIDFLCNSIPLKIIQYGICGKRVLIPKIAWFEKQHTPNVEIVKPFTADKLLSACECMLKNTSHDEEKTKLFWDFYTWENLLSTLENESKLLRNRNDA